MTKGNLKSSFAVLFRVEFDQINNGRLPTATLSVKITYQLVVSVSFELLQIDLGCSLEAVVSC
jgi:hypothetical protein